MAYLYGASVQGIQDFIFKTNKLQEIVGASEIVKSINLLKDKDNKNSSEITFLEKFNPSKILLNAAGNIKVIFNSEDECKKAVLDYPKIVMQNAYGITISQAVIKLQGDYPSDADFKKLDENLKIQRNKPSIPLDMHINILELNPKTAKPIVEYKEDEKLDEASKQKRVVYSQWFKEKRDENPDFKELKELKSLSNGKNKLAVIHVDGNGLGNLVPQLKDNLSTFSKKLDEATKEAFKSAKTEKMKIREVILGGDDLTVICDANEALEFTKNYLQNFEKNTSEIEELKGLTDKLTACAGIAYSNEKYPFHYAVSLAETLCSYAKNASNREASCMMFHNIQSANFQSWDKFVKDELTIINDKQSIRCDYGPYYLNKEDEPKIEDLQNTISAYACDGSPISRLRNWLSELHKSDQYAKNLLARINEMAKQSKDWDSCIMDKNLEKLDRELSNEKLIVDGKTPIYDVLQILSVTEA